MFYMLVRQINWDTNLVDKFRAQGSSLLAVLVAQLCPNSVAPHGLSPARLLCSVEFSGQEYWIRLPFPSSGDLHDPGIEPGSLAWQADSLLSEPPGIVYPTPTTIIVIVTVWLPFPCKDKSEINQKSSWFIFSEIDLFLKVEKFKNDDTDKTSLRLSATACKNTDFYEPKEITNLLCQWIFLIWADSALRSSCK